MIRRETITVDAHVARCDGCGAIGPHSEFEKSDVAAYLEDAGWSHDPDTEKDYCKKCSAAHEDGQ